MSNGSAVDAQRIIAAQRLAHGREAPRELIALVGRGEAAHRLIDEGRLETHRVCHRWSGCPAAGSQPRRLVARAIAVRRGQELGGREMARQAHALEGLAGGIFEEPPHQIGHGRQNLAEG